MATVPMVTVPMVTVPMVTGPISNVPISNVPIGVVSISRWPDQGEGLLHDVDSRRAPCGAPPTAHASRGAELLSPGGQLVSEPLPIPCGDRCPNWTSAQVRVVELKTGGPFLSSARDIRFEFGVVGEGGAKAGRTDHRAVAAGQTSIGHLLPMRMEFGSGQQGR